MKQSFHLLTVISALSAATTFADTVLPVVHTRADQPDILNTETTPGLHTHVELDKFQYSNHQLENILEQQSGIQVRHIGGRGQFSYPSIRGASGQQLQVIWDDIPLTSLNSSESEVPSIGLSALQAIDIYRGLAPVELAPTAIGGTIHLKSKSTVQTDHSGSANLSAGSFGYYGAGIWQRINKHHWGVFTAWDWMTSDNDFKHTKTRNSYETPNERATEKRLNNGTEHQLGLLRLDYSGFQSWQPSILLQYQNKNRELPGLSNIPDNRAFFETEDWRQSVSLRYLHSDNSSSKLVLSNYQQQEIYDDRGDHIGLGRQRDLYQTHGLIARVNHQFLYGHTNYLGTISLQRETTNSKDDLNSPETTKNLCAQGNSCPTEFIRQQLHVGGRATWLISSNLTANGQLSHIRLNDQLTPLFSQPKNEQNEVYTTGDIGFEYFLMAPFSISAVYSKQLRPATTRELFGDRGLTLGNDNLKAESSEGFDITSRYDHLLGTFELSLYQRLRSNAIVGSADSRGVIKYQNIAETLHHGIEFTYNLDITRRTTLSGNIGWHQQLVSEHDRQSFEEKRIPNQRSWDSSYALSYLLKSWKLSFEYLNQTGGYYDISNQIPIPDRSILNIRAVYRYSSYSITLEANNLTDNRTSDFSYYPVPGRNYSSKITVKW